MDLCQSIIIIPKFEKTTDVKVTKPLVELSPAPSGAGQNFMQG